MLGFCEGFCFMECWLCCVFFAVPRLSLTVVQGLSCPKAHGIFLAPPVMEPKFLAWKVES